MSSCFDYLCAVMIIGNAVLLGYQVEAAAQNNMHDPPKWTSSVQIVFTTWFVIELILRVWATGLQAFLMHHWEWNLFDAVVIPISVLEIVLNHTQPSTRNTQFGIVRIFKIMRLVRIIRIIRVVRFFSELRLMVYSSLKSFRPFFCAMVLMTILVYMFSVHVVQAVNEYKVLHSDLDDDPAMNDFFGSLWKSMYTLFQAISGGLNWREPAKVLLSIHWSYAIWMSLFVSFCVFAVLNIVNGIFVGQALQAAQEDQDVVIADAINEENSYAQSILRIFMEADTDNNGMVDEMEFQKHLADRRVKAYLHHLGLDIQEAVGLFRLLDIGNTGKVDRKEFVLGCMRLKGPAKNVDMATLLYEHKRMMDIWSKFMLYVEDQFASLSSNKMSGLSSQATNELATAEAGKRNVGQEDYANATSNIQL